MLSLEDLKKVLEKEDLKVVRPVDRESLLNAIYVYVLASQLSELKSELSELKTILSKVLENGNSCSESSKPVKKNKKSEDKVAE